MHLTVMRDYQSAQHRQALLRDRFNCAAQVLDWKGAHFLAALAKLWTTGSPSDSKRKDSTPESGAKQDSEERIIL